MTSIAPPGSGFGSDKGSSQGTSLPVSGASQDELECPFCGDVFEVVDSRLGTVWGHCDRCREMVAVEVEFQL